MKRDISSFREKILIDAIKLVEDNDYVGLLINNAKMVIQAEGRSFNRQTPMMLAIEITEALKELENYRILNLSLIEMNASADLCDYGHFERYFKSRIISGKRILSKLCKFIPYFSESNYFQHEEPETVSAEINRTSVGKRFL